MNTFKLTVATPDKNVFDGEAVSLLVKTEAGDVEILAKHSDLIAAVGTGRAKITLESGARIASCSGGMLTVKDGAVKLLAITFEYSDEIDLERARAAKERAEAALRAAKDESEARIARARLGRAIARISAATKKQ